MYRTFLAALVAVPTLVACAHRPQSFETLAPESASQASSVRPDVPRGTTASRRAYLTALEGIALTPKQWSRLDQIREKYRIRVQSLDPHTSAENQELAMQLMRSQLDEVRALLTPEQRPVFDRNLEAIRNRGPRRGLARADR